MKIKDLIEEEIPILKTPDEIFEWLYDHVTCDDSSRSMLTLKRDMISITDGVIDSKIGIVFNDDVRLKKLPVTFGKVNQLFECKDLGLTSFAGFPSKIIQTSSSNGYLSATGNDFTSLDGIARSVSEIVLTNCNKITSLKNVHKYIDSCERLFVPGSVKSNLLGVLKIKDLAFVHFQDHRSTIENDKLTRACNIINVYLERGHIGNSEILACQQELIDNDLDDYAEL